MDRLLSILSGLNCTTESDPNDRSIVWAVSPRNENIIAFPKSYPIPRGHAIEIMKHLDVFGDFLTKLGFKINRQQPPLG